MRRKFVDLNMTYVEKGSVAGRRRIATHPMVVDYAGSDSSVSLVEYGMTTDLQMIPTMAG